MYTHRNEVAFVLHNESWPTWSLPNSDDDHRKNIQDIYYMHAGNLKGIGE